MTHDQINAFVSAAGVNPSAVGITIGLITGATAFLWVANAIRKLGFHALEDRGVKKKQFVIYTIRALLLVMIMLYFLT